MSTLSWGRTAPQISHNIQVTSVALIFRELTSETDVGLFRVNVVLDVSVRFATNWPIHSHSIRKWNFNDTHLLVQQWRVK